MFFLEKDSSAEREALKFLKECEEVAKSATCERSHCGSVIVSEGVIIARGFNSPPGNLVSQKRCQIKKNAYDEKVTDKTCCVHAEERAIMDALKNNPEKLVGSRLYFLRLNKNGEREFAGQPYCTICSKLALDAGVKEFVLFHEEGIGVYETEEYNDLSFNYAK